MNSTCADCGADARPPREDEAEEMTNGYTIAAALRAEAASVGPTDPTRAKKLNDAADLHERAAEQRGDPR